MQSKAVSVAANNPQETALVLVGVGLFAYFVAQRLGDAIPDIELGKHLERANDAITGGVKKAARAVEPALDAISGVQEATIEGATSFTRGYISGVAPGKPPEMWVDQKARINRWSLDSAAAGELTPARGIAPFYAFNYVPPSTAERVGATLGNVPYDRLISTGTFVEDAKTIGNKLKGWLTPW